MEIKYLNKNRTYTNPTIIKPEFVVVHSTAVGMKSRYTLFNALNTKTSDKSCHGMVDADADGCMITLPLDFRGWHIGSLGNSRSVGFEIAEPPAITYKDKNHCTIDTTKYDPQDAGVVADMNLRFRNAMDMAAYMCEMTGIDADHVLCHAEMNQRGLGTAHVDVLHWWPLFGDAFSMDAFRRGVEYRLMGKHVEFSVNTTGVGKPPYRVRKSWTDVRTQKGAFNLLENAKACAAKNPGYFVFNNSGNKV